MGRPQVSIRLGMTGRSDVEKDFAAIGDSGDAQAKRYQASWERASKAAEAALERQAKAAARLSSGTAAPSGATNMVNPITASSYAMVDGRAQASAAAFAQQLEQGEASARRLLAAVDPLYAAQMRYDQALAEANMLQRQGLLVGDQYTKVTSGLKSQLDESTVLYGKQGTAVGNTRIAQMELMHVVRGSVDQYAAGAAPMQIFTMHLGMMGQAAALSGESMGKFGAFMASGWGLALTVAVVALAPLIAKLFEAGHAVDDLVEKEKKEGKQQVDSIRAHELFTKSLDGVEKTIRDLTKAYDEYLKRLKTAPEQELEAARAALKTADANRNAAIQALNRAKAELALQNSLAIGPETKGHVDPRLAAANAARGDIEAQMAAIQRAGGDIAAAQRMVDQFQSIVTAETASEDKLQQIKRHYDDLVSKASQRAAAEAKSARAAGDSAKANALVTTELDKQIRALRDKQKVEEDAERERERKPGKNAGGEAIFDSQISAFFDEAAKFRGMSETRDKGVLESFFREANLQLDPEKTAWCAAFVNAVLANQGVKGTGSLAAKSFLTFGKDDTHSPQQGDIAVVRSKGSPSGEHVGFVQSTDKNGNVTVLGGNTCDKVGTATYSKSQILAIRRPPTPSEAAAAADKATQDAARAAAEAIQQQQTFDGEREKLNQQYLQALGKVVAGYDAQATVQLMRAQGEHDAEAKEIASNLAAGKYGDATSQLAQARAQQLQSANDQVLSERKAAIALDSYAKSLRMQDDANERETKFKLDGLQYSESLARTAGERRKLQLEIIDVEYKEKERHLQYLLALDQLLGNTEDAAKIAAELAHLPAEKARDQGKAANDNKTPFEEYRDSLPKNAAEAGAAMQTSLTEGLKSLNSGLDDALLKSKNFKELWSNIKGVFHDVAMSILKDLIDLTIKMFIIRPLMNALAGGMGGGGGFASGTEYFGGGSAWVGEHGAELVRLPRGSKIHTAADSRRMAANDRGAPSVTVPINIDATGADAAGLARVEDQVRQLRAELPGLVVQHWSDADSRFVFSRGRGR